MKIFRKDKEKEKEKPEGAHSHSHSPVLSAGTGGGSGGGGGGGSHNKEPASTSTPSRSRTSTGSPLQGSTGAIKKENEGGGGGGSLGRSSQQGLNDPKKQQHQQQHQQHKDQQQQQQHAIRIGDTRFYGRIICKAKALYDYPLDGDTLQVEDEEIKLLKFKKGDIINVYEQDVSGWWAGEFNEEKGIFPGSYMKVLEEEPAEKNKAKTQTVSREDLIHKINELEAEREEMTHDHERDRAEFNKIIKEIKGKADTEVLEMKKLLAERDEVIQASAKKIRATEKDLEEVAAKLAAKEVEVLTMELEVQECKAKLSEKAETPKKVQQDDRDRNGSANQLKNVQAELNSRNLELQELNRQKLEVEKSVRDAKAKLTSLESQILRKVMTSPLSSHDNSEKGEDIDLLKKQLGEEVFEKRRMENEIREMKRLCVDVENLKTDKARLEAELATKVELENKLTKIGVINKDSASLTVSAMKDLLTKVRKGIAANPNGLKTSSAISGSSGVTGSSLGSSGGQTNSRPASPTPTKQDPKPITTRPKTSTLYKDST